MPDSNREVMGWVVRGSWRWRGRWWLSGGPYEPKRAGVAVVVVVVVIL